MNFIYGLVPVVEALRAGRRTISKIVIATSVQPSRLNELIQLARGQKVTLERRDRRDLDEFAKGGNHQGVIALLSGSDVGGRKTAGYFDAEELLDNIAGTPFLVLLDCIEDPHNLGAILRTCECAGVDGIFLPEHRSAGLTETVAKISAGAIEYVKVAKVTNLVTLIADLKQRGIFVVGVEGGMDTVYTEVDMTVPLALVMGSEGKGVRRLVKEKCDALISIPMLGKINSLNVSVATGVVLFEAQRQRAGKAKTA